MTNKHVLIVGSGHSVAAGLPTVGEITRAVVTHPNSWICSDAPDRELQAEILARVHDHLSRPGVEVNYEAMYTWIWTRYFSNDPTMYRVAWDDHDPFLNLGFGPDLQTRPAAYRALRAIESAVMHHVESRRATRPLPSVIKKLAKSEVTDVTVITTNHDLLIEQALGDDFRTCFGATDSDVPELQVWSPETGSVHRHEDRSVKLIKLHGSIDWWSSRAWSDGGLVYCGPPDAAERLRAKQDEGESPQKLSEIPLILTGTAPKIMQAGNLMFAQQILDAGRALQEADVVHVIGYGFGDLRLNALWNQALINGSVTAPSLVFDPNPGAVRNRLASTPHSTLAERFCDANGDPPAARFESKPAQDIELSDLCIDVQQDPVARPRH